MVWIVLFRASTKIPSVIGRGNLDYGFRLRHRAHAKGVQETHLKRKPCPCSGITNTLFTRLLRPLERAQ
jgi:hypothetical protein